MTAIVQDSFRGYCEQLERIVSAETQQYVTQFSNSESHSIFNDIRKRLDRWQLSRLNRIGKFMAAITPKETFTDLFGFGIDGLEQVGYHVNFYPSIYGDQAHLTVKTCRGLSIANQILNDYPISNAISCIEVDIKETAGQTQGSKWIAELLSMHTFDNLTGVVLRGNGEIHQAFINCSSTIKTLQHLSASTKSDETAHALLTAIKPLPFIESLEISELESNNSWKLLSEFTSLKHLQLFSGNLSKIGSNSLKQLESLTSLVIAMWTLNQTQISAIASLSQLRSLNLANNAIPKTSFAKLFELQQLRDLNLYNTGATSDSFDFIGDINKLISLNIGNNCLDDKILKSLTNLTQLISLNLDNTHLKTPDFSLLNRKTLTELHIGSNQLIASSLESIKTLRNLQQLNVDNMSSISASYFDFSALPSLCCLDMNRIDLRAQNLKSLLDLPNLRQLSLFNNCELADESCLILSELRFLTQLDIGNTGITSKGFSHFQSLTQLHYLRVTGNNLKGIDFSFIKKFPKLYWIDLGRCELTTESCRDLAESTIKELWIYNNHLDDNFVHSLILSKNRFIEIILTGNRISAEAISSLREYYENSNISN